MFYPKKAKIKLFSCNFDYLFIESLLREEHLFKEERIKMIDIKKNFMVNNYIEVLKKYIKFEGNADRAEFWWFALANVIVAFLLGMISGQLAMLYAFAVLLPGLAVGTRRLRDAGFSPLLMVLLLIPLVQFAVIVLWIFPSKR